VGLVDYTIVRQGPAAIAAALARAAVSAGQAVAYCARFPRVTSPGRAVDALAL